MFYEFLSAAGSVFMVCLFLFQMYIHKHKINTKSVFIIKTILSFIVMFLGTLDLIVNNYINAFSVIADFTQIFAAVIICADTIVEIAKLYKNKKYW